MFAVSLLLLAACASTRPAADPVQVLLDADRAFARDALERGESAAFLAVLAEGAVLFRPAPLHAHTWLEEHPDGPEVLEWWPDTAEVAGSGDLGWTSGAWELREPDREEQRGASLARGRYLTVWRRHGEAWRLLADHGVELPAGTAVERPESLSRLEPGPRVPAQGPTQDFAASDRRLAAAIDAGGHALRERLDPQVVVLRPGRVIEGLPAALGAWAEFHPLHSATGEGVATSGDGRLGATWGTLQGPGGREAWLRVWRVAGAGEVPRLVLDVQTPAGEPAIR